MVFEMVRSEPIMAQGWKSWINKIIGLLGLDMSKHNNKAALHKAKASRPENKNTSNAMTQVLQPAYTRRLRPEPEEKIASCETETVPFALSWHGLTDTGMVRPHNEDSFSFLDLGKGMLFAVADGMGGHDAGEIASKIAVETVCREMREGVEQNKAPLDLVQHAVQQANAAVKQEGASRGSNMGTTLTMAFIAGNTAYVANVGDSRVYWVENGSITQITEDHSLVAKLVAVGKLSKEEARNHPKSNLLYRTIGSDDTVKVDTFRMDLKKGGLLLLCTDGLWGMIGDESIHQIFAAEKNVKKACARLVRMANDNGGLDNITAMVAKIME
jgi:serine/threonine protein phosphatase PrpC